MDAYFEEMINRLKLTKRQRDDARNKYTTVAELLHAEFYDTAYNGSTKLIIGSFGKHTNIRPPEDVDLLFKIPEDIYVQYENSPGSLLQRIRKVIGSHYTTVEKISAWGKVVLVQFSEGNHNVELLPGFELGNVFMIPNTEDGGSWESFDVRTEMKAISGSDTLTNGVTRKLIRMIKKWSKFTKTVTVKSFHIEEYCVTFLESYDLAGKSWSTIVHDFFIWLQPRALDDSSQIKSAISRSSKAIDFESVDKVGDACLEWQKVFGEKAFPSFRPNLEKAYSMSINESSEDEMYIEDIVSVSIDPSCSVSIDSVFEGVNSRPHDFAAFIRGRSLLPKHKSIVFHARVDGLEDYNLKWKIRNFGPFAKAAGALRGEINDGDGLTRKESTLYKGIHYVECYVISNNVCVARSLELVPIGEN
jgi:hypothetical protein